MSTLCLVFSSAGECFWMVCTSSKHRQKFTELWNKKRLGDSKPTVHVLRHLSSGHSCLTRLQSAARQNRKREQEGTFGLAGIVFVLEELIWSTFGGIVLNLFSFMYSSIGLVFFPLVKTEDYGKYKFNMLLFLQVICVFECFWTFIKMLTKSKTPVLPLNCYYHYPLCNRPIKGC